MEPLLFQITDMVGNDVEQSKPTDLILYGKQVEQKKISYRITIFGRLENNASISVTLKGFKPYFYIENEGALLDPSQLKLLEEWLKQKLYEISYQEKIINRHLPKNQQESVRFSGLHSIEQIEGYKMHGFQWNKTTNFIKLSFNTYEAMKKMSNCLLNHQKNPYCCEFYGRTFTQFKVYESNIEPLLRFLHIKEIRPSSWVCIEKYVLTNKHKTKYDLVCNWNEIKPMEIEKLGKYVIASFDIECDSSHGNFPLASKNYSKFVNDLMDTYAEYIKHGRIVTVSDVKLWYCWAFQMERYKTKELCAKFNNPEDLMYQNIIETIYTKQNEKPTDNNIEKMSIYTNYLLHFYNQKDEEGTVDKKTMKFANVNIYNTLLAILEGRKEDIVTKEDLHMYTGIARFPPMRGDEVIQIGTVFCRYGESHPYRKVIVTLNTCDALDGIDVIACEQERDVLIQWANLIGTETPDILTGYNIFGFDYQFIWTRAKELNMEDLFRQLISRKKEHYFNPRYDSKIQTKKLQSAGLGENYLHYPNLVGVVQVDVLKVVQRDYKLASYKLDDVSTNFIHGKILNWRYDSDKHQTIVQTDNPYGLSNNDYIHIFKNTCVGEEHLEDGLKYQLVKITTSYDEDDETEQMRTCYELIIEAQLPFQSGEQYLWGLAKDDVSPQQIFKFQKETSKERAIIAKYCIQDCVLVLHLFLKLDILPNNVGMSNVCFVPLQYIFTRGQGIKTFSLVAYECRKEEGGGYMIPTLFKEYVDTAEKKTKIYDPEDFEDYIYNTAEDHDEKEEEQEIVTESYEGALVITPKPGIYYEPLSTMDYNSLYPSCIISENLSHETEVLEAEYQGEEGGIRLKEMGYEYVDVSYDNYEYVVKGKQKRKQINEQKPVITCRFIQPATPEKRGIIPKILMKLLKARKDTRNRIAKEPDPFKKTVLDGLQLAYKVTANSIYGSIGASVNPIYFKDVAACTTATGRNMLKLAQQFIVSNYAGAEIVYGDTDSLFVNFHPKDEQGNLLMGKEALQKSIELGEDVEHNIKKILKYPHCLEYEKTFYPFVLFTKKRYIGNKYTTDTKKFTQTSMGIVLKRRDNANILKYVYGQVINIVLNQCNLQQSLQCLQELLQRVITHGSFPLEYFVVSKSLKSHYKNPEAQVHKNLADRMAERDPGNKPQINDRIPYVYIDIGDREVSLQGERVEHPNYIREHNLRPDYLFYITNQIAKPICQIYSLVLEQLPNYTRPANYYEQWVAELRKHGIDEDKIKKKIAEERGLEVFNLLFKPLIDQEIERKQLTIKKKRSSTRQKTMYGVALPKTEEEIAAEEQAQQALLAQKEEMKEMKKKRSATRQKTPKQSKQPSTSQPSISQPSTSQIDEEEQIRIEKEDLVEKKEKKEKKVLISQSRQQHQQQRVTTENEPIVIVTSSPIVEQQPPRKRKSKQQPITVVVNT